MSVSETEPVAAPIWLDRRTPPHIVTLVLLTGLSALSLNVILPSLPSIAAWYGADYGVAALAVSAYLGLTAILQLLLGPLSDRYGRRPVLLACFGLFLVATVGCLFAPTIEALIGFRMAQAAIASGIVLCRAIVRDMVPPAGRRACSATSPWACRSCRQAGQQHQRHDVRRRPAVEPDGCGHRLGLRHGHGFSGGWQRPA